MPNMGGWRITTRKVQQMDSRSAENNYKTLCNKEKEKETNKQKDQEATKEKKIVESTGTWERYRNDYKNV